MKTMTRRLASAIVGGGLAIASLSGCGLIGGSALDCAAIADSMNEVATTMSGTDDAAFNSALDKLRSEASDISDAELKKAVEDYATLAEDIHNFDPATSDPADLPDVSEATAMQSTFSEKCSAV